MLIFLGFSSTSLMARPWYEHSECCEGDAWVGLGYRQDHIKWSISGFDGVPNILSELKWKNLGIIETTFQGWNAFRNGFYYRYGGSFGSIVNGSVTDSDYLGNDETLLFSRSRSNAGRGRTLDLIGGLGWQFSFFNDGLLIAGVGGLSMHQQHLHIFRGVQTFNLFYPQGVGPIFGLDSKYYTRWSGGWGGVDVVWQLCREFVFNGNFEYHNVRYKARGTWNLRPDFDGDYFHHSKGHGLVGRAGFCYAFRGDWLFYLFVCGQDWRCKGGTDTTNLFAEVSDATGIVTMQSLRVQVPFHEVRWKSLGGQIAIEYRY